MAASMSGLRASTSRVAPASRARSVPSVAVRPHRRCAPVRALEIDFSDPDTQVAMAGLVLGVVAGLGAPIWYINRVEKDEERLEELRALNRANYEATGEYMNDDEISSIRKPKWTDRREWQDDD